MTEQTSESPRFDEELEVGIEEAVSNVRAGDQLVERREAAVAEARTMRDKEQARLDRLQATKRKREGGAGPCG